MAKRQSSFTKNTTTSEVSRNIDNSTFDIVKIVADNINNVVLTGNNMENLLIVTSIEQAIKDLSDRKAKLDNLYNDKEVLDSLYTDKSTLDSLYNDKTILDSLYADKNILDTIFDSKDTLDSLYIDKAKLDSLYADKATLDSLYNDKTTLDRLYQSIANIDRLVTSADNIDRLSESADNINTTAEHIANIDTTTAHIDNIDTTATHISSVDTVATSIANVNTIADNVNDVTYFADIYQGPKSEAPTTRNDGTDLQNGDLYFQVGSDDIKAQMMEYDATNSVWLSVGSTVNGTSKRETFTAEADQTEFTITGGYDAGYADVFLNGRKLVNGDEVDVSDGTKVVLSDGASEGDVIDVVAYGIFSVADTYSKAEVYNKDELTKSIGNINNPLLDLPLNNSLTMKQGTGSVDFTRNTTATYIDRYGVLQYADIDEPRFEKDGLLIEGSSTNILLHSGNLTDDVWTGTATITEEGNAPDNTNSSFKVEDTEDDTTNYINQSQSIDDDEESYSFSIFLKKGDSQFCQVEAGLRNGTNVYGVVYIDLDNGLITRDDKNVGKLELLTNGWIRCKITIRNNNSGNDTARLLVRPVTNFNETDAALLGYTYAWGGQIEKLPFTSSYISTDDAAVTRAEEYLKVDGYNNWKTTVGSTVILDILGLGSHNTDQYVFSRFPTNHYNAVIKRSSGSLDFYNTTRNICYDFNDRDIVSKTRLVLTTDEINSNIYVDGELLATTTNTTDNYVPDSVYIGGRNSTTLSYYGHITNFKSYDFALTPTEARLA